MDELGDFSLRYSDIHRKAKEHETNYRECLDQLQEVSEDKAIASRGRAELALASAHIMISVRCEKGKSGYRDVKLPPVLPLYLRKHINSRIRGPIINLKPHLEASLPQGFPHLVCSELRELRREVKETSV